MSKTYSVLKELLNHTADMQMNMLQKFLYDMDDNEFSQIPALLFTPDQKKLVETYGAIINVSRKNSRPGLDKEYIDHTIYCIFPAIFKIIT